MAKKALTPERGLRLHETYDGCVHDMIMEHGWLDFTKQPEVTIIPVVKEFYANAKEAKNHVVQVRGKVVSFDKARINAYYNIANMSDDDEYTKYRTEELNLDEVIKCLCKPGATWTLKGTEMLYFSHSELSRFGKAWYYFLCANLMPTTHFTELLRDRAVLLYCIVIGKNIIVGQVIQDSITQAIKGGSTSGLPHPSLICRLCKKTKVTWSDDEFVQQSKVPIDHQIISRFKVWKGGFSDHRGAGYIMVDMPQESGEPSEPPQATNASSQSPMKSLIDEMCGLRRETQELYRETKELHRESRRESRRNDQLAHHLDSFMEYSTEFNSALV